LRADRRWAVLPVLVLTGRTDPETVRSAFDSGADDFVAKPIALYAVKRGGRGAVGLAR
jgi:DNA-binding response OmpR family regulator